MTQELIDGRYRLERAVGEGGMGTVWLGRDEVLQRPVAVKRIGVVPGESADDRRRAMREARTAAALNHRHAVSVFDVVDHGNAAWIVMEYHESRTLAEVLADGPLPVERVARIGAQVAEALAAAHAMGVIHRDVKPGNILVGDDDETKISDFGIAQPILDERLTRTGLVSGTPSYFSPELARGAEPGPATDVWALGASLYAAVEGNLPHARQPNALATLQTIAHEPVPHPVRAGLLTEPLMRMLDRDPTTRWTMAEAADGLRGMTGRLDAHTVPAAGPTRKSRVEPSPTPTTTSPTPAPAPSPSPSPSGSSSRRSRVFPVALVAAALLLVVIGTLVALSLGDPDPVTGPQDDGETPAAEQSSTPSEPDDSETPEESEEPSEEPSEEASEVPSSQAPPSAPAPGGTPVETVDGYFDTVPDDLDTGWATLAPSMRQRVGRGNYDGFWATIADVDAQDVRQSGNTVTATVTYTRTDGTTSVENQVFTLVPASGGGYLIASDR